MARNMRQNALSGANARCPVCRAKFVKHRAWQTFCSQKCRKANWSLIKRTGAYIDVRQVLAGIRTDLDRVMRHLGVTKGE